MRLGQDTAVDEQQPVKQSVCGSLKRDTHWKCLILTLLIYSCLAAIAWCRVTVVTKEVTSVYEGVVSRASPCDDGYIYIPVAFVIMLYLVYLVECWHSHTRIELQYKVDVNTVYDRVRTMRQALPIIWWKAVCYHYVRRTRQVTRYRNGDAFTTTQVYYERVNSHGAGSAFSFNLCGAKDVSKVLSGLENYPATKIRFSKGFSFATFETECEFEEQRSRFFQENERRDDYMESQEGMDLLDVNFKEYMIAFADPGNLPWYVSHMIFWLASFLLLSWPLRVIIEYKTAYVHFHVHKLFGTNYVDSTFGNGQLSRVSTMESSELEMNIRNNYSIVPSYSEALLIEPMVSYTMQTPDANGNLPAAMTHRSYTFASLSNIHSSGVIRETCSNGHLVSDSRPSSCITANGVVSGGNVSNVDDSATGNDGDDTDASQGSRRRRQRRRKKRRRSNDNCRRAPPPPPTLPSTPESPEECAIISDSQVAMMRRTDKRQPVAPPRPPTRSGATRAPPERVSSEDESPPCYEDALGMQQVLEETVNPNPLATLITSSESSRLADFHDTQRSYRTLPLMETSL